MPIDEVGGPSEIRPVGGRGDERRRRQGKHPHGRPVVDESPEDLVILSEAARALSEALEDKNGD